MITMEQVESLRVYADVTYEEAKEALEACNGDLLEAVIYLEKLGKMATPPNGGTYRTEENKLIIDYRQAGGSVPPDKEENSFSEQVGKLWRAVCKLVHKGNINHFVATKEERCVLSVPVNLLILSFMFFFWITLPMLIVGLFLNYNYKFVGPDLGKDTINNVMETASETAENIKKSVAKDEK